MKEFSEKDALGQINKNKGKAETLLNDADEVERFLQRLEKKLAEIPVAGSDLARIPTLISLVKSYTKGEYRDVPISTIIAIVAALMYFLSPIDLIPDFIPVIGLSDDVTVVLACWKLVESDVEEYRVWRKDNGKEYI